MALMPESRLGPYEIRSLLGSGGMGEVYLAHDTRLGRDVALKVLPEPVSGNPDRLKRFEQEARAAAALNHPGILAVHDVGWHNGSPYIVSELLEGETLRERLRAGALPVRKALEVALPLARALAAAHEKGIVHRDLKPENVFLTRDGQVKVLDFGLAKLLPSPDLESESERDGNSTVSGTVLGTTSYMSPEQLRGQKTGAGSDVFSFGVLLYEMLAGRRPFLGESAADVEAAILQQDPVRLLDLDVAVSPLLERITERCLEKRPEDRFASAHELAVALEAVSGAESASALSGPTARKLRRLARRRWVSAAVLLLLLASGAGWAFWRSRRTGAAAPIESLAVLPLLNLSGDAEQEYFADGITEALIANLAKIRAVKVISRTSVMQYKTTRKPLPEIARELNVDAVVEGSVLRSGNRVRVTAQLIRAATDEHLWAETYDRGMTDILALQGDIVRAIAGEVRIKVTSEEEARLTTARTVDPEAYSLYLKGRYQLNTSFWTKGGVDKAITGLEQAAQRDPTLALAWAGLAEAHTHTVWSSFVRPEQGYAKAKAIIEKALALDPNLPEALATLGWIRFAYDWDFTGADQALLRAVQLGPSSVPAHSWYSWVLVLQGRSDEAVAEGRRMLELDPASVLTNAWLSSIYFNARRFEESIAQAEKIRDLNPTAADLMLCWSYAGARRYPQALAACDRAMAEVVIGQNIVAEATVAWAWGVAGRPSEAIKILETWKRLGPDAFVDSYQMAKVYAGLGDNERALESLEKAYAERSTYTIGLKVDVMFDGFRTVPRYEQLMRRVGFRPS